MKAEANETYLHPKEAELEQYCLTILNCCESKKDAFAKQQGDTQTLNNLLRSIIEQPWP